MSFTNTYKFAETVVRVTYESEYITKQCKDYVSDETPEIEITLTAADVEYERERADGEFYKYGYLESLAFYRRFCSDIVHKNIILFHSSAIAVDGKAYLFAAPSGTGKSTHTRLWRETFGEQKARCVYAGSADKALDEVLELLSTIVGEWVLPPVQSPRILSPAEMADKVQAVSAAPVSTPPTLAECLADMPAGTLICGSFFLLGEAKAHLQQHPDYRKTEQ